MEIGGSIAVVTGASSGIGRATALALARRDAHVVLAARRRERLDELERFIASKGGKALAVTCDITQSRDVRRLATVVDEAFGRCDILVNNAGMPSGKPFEETSYELIDQVVATNLLSVLHATKAFLPMMRRRRRGHVVNVASLAGRHAVPGAAIYSATKHAVVAFSESMNHETRAYGVLVTAINPGLVDTESFPKGNLPGVVMIPVEMVARAIVRAIDKGQAPQVSVPRWTGALELGRMLAPGPYRWVAGRTMMSRKRGAARLEQP